MFKIKQESRNSSMNMLFRKQGIKYQKKEQKRYQWLTLKIRHQGRERLAGVRGRTSIFNFKPTVLTQTLSIFIQFFLKIEVCK